MKSDSINKIQSKIFENKNTSRKGMIDSWRNNISDDIVLLLKSQLEDLKYIQDLDYDFFGFLIYE